MVDRGFALCESEMPKRRTATGLDSAFVPSPDSPGSQGHDHQASYQHIS